ncbi:unnamed protein product [Taenia asiatica]|uniref:Uncharacterized protein n=1 Tax=Taenia asiatica TaxID=60517 RepID=A0A0R3WH24_TAEAS|nr:unnamed protein product [Taenia asiatica]
MWMKKREKRKTRQLSGKDAGVGFASRLPPSPLLSSPPLAHSPPPPPPLLLSLAARAVAQAPLSHASLPG